MNKLKELIKCLILFLLGGGMYIGIEMLWRGYSHWTMGIVGGLCFVIIGGLNNYIPWKMTLQKQAAIGTLVVTSIEFISGIILNLFLQLHIWDYSNLPFNILGQICLPFTILWFFLCIVAIIVDDYLRYFLFHEEKPEYYLSKKGMV